MACNEKRQYPLQNRIYEEAFKRFFSPGKAPFWVAIGVGVSALAGGIAAMLVDRHKRQQKPVSKTISPPSDISAIEVGSGFYIRLSFGAKQSLTITTHKRMKDRVMCDMRGGRLRLYIVPDMKRSRSYPVEVVLLVESLSAISLGANSSIVADGTNVVDEFNLKQHSADLTGLNIEAEHSTIKMTGCFVGDIAFSKGALSVSMMGNGFAILNVDAASVDTRLAGECVCLINGAASNFNCHASGYCDVQAKGFVPEKASISLVESASCEIYRAEAVDLSLSDHSRLILNTSPCNKGRVSVRDNAELLYVERPTVSPEL